MQQLADPIQVRLPNEIVERLKIEASRQGIPMSLLIRRSVMLEYGGEPSSFVPENYGNSVDNTGKKHLGQEVSQ